MSRSGAFGFEGIVSLLVPRSHGAGRTSGGENAPAEKNEDGETGEGTEWIVTVTDDPAHRPAKESGDGRTLFLPEAVFHGKEDTALAAIDTGVAHDFGELTIGLRGEGLLKGEPRKTVASVGEPGNDVAVDEPIEVEFARRGPRRIVVGNSAGGGTGEVERHAGRIANTGPDHGALDEGVGEADFAFGGKVFTEQDVTLNANAVGVEGFADGTFEGATVTFEIVADLRAEEIHFAFGGKTGTKKNETANVDAVGIEGHAAGIFEDAGIAGEVIADLSAGKIDFAVGGEAVMQEHVSFDGDAVGVQRDGAGVGEFATVAFEIAVNLSAEEANFAHSGETVTEKQAALDGHAIAAESAAAGVRKGAVVTFEVATDFGAEQAHFAFGDEGVAEEKTATDTNAVGTQSFTTGVAETAGTAIEIAADASAKELDFTFRTKAIVEKDGAFHFGALGVQGADPTATQIDGGDTKEAEAHFLFHAAARKAQWKTDADEGEIEGTFDARAVGLNAAGIDKVASFAIDAKPANEIGANGTFGPPGIGFSGIVGRVEILGSGTAPGGVTGGNGSKQKAFGVRKGMKAGLREFEEGFGDGGEGWSGHVELGECLIS